MSDSNIVNLQDKIRENSKKIDPEGVGKKRIPIKSGSDLRGKLKPKQWILENFFPETYVALLGGPGEVGKSFITLQIALSVSCGWGFIKGIDFDGFQPPGNRGRGVLYLSAEDDEETIKERFQACVSNIEKESGVLFNALNKEIDANFHYMPICGSGGIKLTDKEQRDDFIQQLKEFNKENNPIKLIIAEPMIFFAEGDFDKQEAVKNIVEALQEIAKETESCFLTATHTKKGSGWDKITPDDMSGSHGLRDYVRVVFRMRPATSAEKLKGIDAILQIEKANNLPSDLKSEIPLKRVEGGTLVYHAGDIRPFDIDFTAVLEWIRDDCKDGLVTKGKLITKIINIYKDSVPQGKNNDKVFRQMEKEKLIKLVGVQGKGNAHFYGLDEDGIGRTKYSGILKKSLN